MDDDGQSGLDSPTTQSNPGTPLPAHQLPAGTLDACFQTRFDTKLNADSVEWCPIPSKREILACGTYELIEGQVQQRIGTIQLLHWTNGNVLENIQKIHVPAILDCKWCPHALGNWMVLGTADANGHLQLYKLQEERLITATHQMVSEDCMALSLDWSSVKHHSEQPLIAVSDSKGRLTIFHLDQQNLCKKDQWKAHEQEAWIAAFDYWRPNVVYSGGDDCRLKGWDIRTPTRTATFISRQHSMGVTSIQSNKCNSNMIASGSYDESICVWDIRWMNSPTSVVKSGGGVWRLKWHPQTGRHLLAACMHYGAIIAHCHTFETTRISTTYRKHDSMVYGIDWQVAPSLPPDHETIASCSFYDNSLHLWTCHLER